MSLEQMQYMVDSSSDDIDDGCGVCGKNFCNDTDLKMLTWFQTRCVLCCQLYNLKEKCARKLLEKEDKSYENNKNKPFDSQTYHKHDPKLFCRTCKQDICFICVGDKKHTGGKQEVCGGCRKKWCWVLSHNVNVKERDKCSFQPRKSGFCKQCKSIEKDQNVSVHSTVEEEMSTSNDNMENSASPVTKASESMISTINNSNSNRNHPNHSLRPSLRLCLKKKVKSPYIIYGKNDKIIIDDNTVVTMIPMIPEKISGQFKATIDEIFDNVTSANESIKTKDDIMDCLMRTFVLMHDETNIFSNRFSVSASLLLEKKNKDVSTASELLVDRNESVTDCPFELNMKDIKGLLSDDCTSRDSVVEFVLKCFNMYCSIMRKDPSLPGTYFGTMSESKKVVIDNASKYSKVYSYIAGTNDTSITTYVCTEEMKRWYCWDNKEFLTKVLISNCRQKINLREYCSLFCVHKHYYAVMQVQILELNNESNKNTPILVVYKIPNTGFSNNSDKEDYDRQLKVIVMCYAKYFGIYWKEYNKDEITEGDFSVEDMKEYYNHEIGTSFTKSIASSMLDVVHCNITNGGEGSLSACLNLCVKWMLRNEKLLPNERMSAKMLLMIHSMYNLYFQEELKLLKEHIYMKNGDVLETNDVDFFKSIHAKFDEGYINLDCETNANTLFQKYQNNRSSFFTDYDDQIEDEDIDSDSNDDDDVHSQRNQTKSNCISMYDATPRSDDFLHIGLQEHQVATLNNENYYFYDTDNKKMYLWKQKSLTSQMPNKKSKLLYPEQIHKILSQFFFRQFHVDGMDSDETKRLQDQIEQMMFDHETHFVMMLPYNQNNFEIVAALILEPEINMQAVNEENGMVYSIFHCIATSCGFDRCNIISKLLDNTIFAKKLYTKDMFFVTQFGDFKYKNVDNKKTGLIKFLKKLHFREEQCNFCMEKNNIIPPNSLTYFAHGQDVYNELGQNTSSTERLRFFRQTCHANLLARYTGDKFQVYNHVRGWYDCTYNPLRDIIPPEIQEKLKTYPNKYHKLGRINGSRNSSNESDLSDNDKRSVLDDKFRQETYKKKYEMDNNCAWLCIAALLNSYDTKAADEMIRRMDDPNTCYQYDWMYLVSREKEMKQFKLSQAHNNIVNDRMKGKGIGYTLAKVRNFQCTKHGYLKYIMNSSTRGQYVVSLGNERQQASHCVAIDCDKKLIYDCMEKYVLSFTRKNLNYCAGSDEIGVHCIPHCYKIIQTARKLPKKRKSDQV